MRVLLTETYNGERVPAFFVHMFPSGQAGGMGLTVPRSSDVIHEAEFMRGHERTTTNRFFKGCHSEVPISFG